MFLGRSWRLISKIAIKLNPLGGLIFVLQLNLDLLFMGITAIKMFQAQKDLLAPELPPPLTEVEMVEVLYGKEQVWELLEEIKQVNNNPPSIDDNAKRFFGL